MHMLDALVRSPYWTVSRAALTARASDIVVQLAQPKKRSESLDKQFLWEWDGTWDSRPRPSALSGEVLGLSQPI